MSYSFNKRVALDVKAGGLLHEALQIGVIVGFGMVMNVLSACYGSKLMSLHIKLLTSIFTEKALKNFNLQIMNHYMYFRKLSLLCSCFNGNALSDFHVLLNRINPHKIISSR